MENEQGVGDNTSVVEWPVLETYESKQIDKATVPPEGLVAKIKKVELVTTKFRNKHGGFAKKLVLRTDKGDIFLRWSEAEKLKTAYGRETMNWNNRTIKLTTMKILVKNEEKLTFIVEALPNYSIGN